MKDDRIGYQKLLVNKSNKESQYHRNLVACWFDLE